jgi:hypothetical protein
MRICEGGLAALARPSSTDGQLADVRRQMRLSTAKRAAMMWQGARELVDERGTDGRNSFDSPNRHTPRSAQRTARARARHQPHDLTLHRIHRPLALLKRLGSMHRADGVRVSPIDDVAPHAPFQLRSSSTTASAWRGASKDASAADGRGLQDAPQGCGSQDALGEEGGQNLLQAPPAPHTQLRDHPHALDLSPSSCSDNGCLRQRVSPRNTAPLDASPGSASLLTPQPGSAPRLTQLPGTAHHPAAPHKVAPRAIALAPAMLHCCTCMRTWHVHERACSILRASGAM